MRREVSGWALGMLLLLSACLTPAQVSQKKAIATENDPVSLAAVGAIWMMQHPCVNDTTIMIQGGDTTVQTDTVLQGGDLLSYYDTARGISRDTLIMRVYINRIIRDTVRIVVKDMQALGLADDSAAYYKTLYLVSQGQATAAQETADYWNDRFHWFLWCTVIGLLFLTVLYFFVKSKL